MKLRDLFRRTCPTSPWPHTLVLSEDLAGGPSAVEARESGLWGVRCNRDGCDFLEVIRGWAVPDVGDHALAILRAHHATAHQDDENQPQEAAPSTGGTGGHRAPDRPGEPPTRTHRGANHVTPTGETPDNTHSGEPTMTDHDPTADTEGPEMGHSALGAAFAGPRPRHGHPTHRTQVRLHQPMELFPPDLVGLLVADPHPETGEPQYLRNVHGDTGPGLEWTQTTDEAAARNDWSGYPALTLLPASLLPKVRDAITAHLGDAATADQVRHLEGQVENAQRYASDLEVRLDAAEKVQEATDALAREKDAHLATQDRHLATMERLAMPQVVTLGADLGDSEAGPMRMGPLTSAPDVQVYGPSVNARRDGHAAAQRAAIADLEDALGGIDTTDLYAAEDLDGRWAYLLGRVDRRGGEDRKAPGED